MGDAEGLALRKRGNDGRSLGSSEIDALIAACTSRAARSMSRPRLNCSAIEVLPVVLLDVIRLTPEISPSLRSSGAATVVAITDGSAPGRDANTRMTGKSMFGTLATGSDR